MLHRAQTHTQAAGIMPVGAACQRAQDAVGCGRRTSKIRVAPPGITPPAPRSPAAHQADDRLDIRHMHRTRQSSPAWATSAQLHVVPNNGSWLHRLSTACWPCCMLRQRDTRLPGSTTARPRGFRFLTVAHVRRDHELALLAHAHALHALVPACTHASPVQHERAWCELAHRPGVAYSSIAQQSAAIPATAASSSQCEPGPRDAGSWG